ncbi:MAG: hypothetical protein OEY14_18810, partial [Myxococcales bacterium]|nr:hypothetical protein [Myxococcales bacterium]
SATGEVRVDREVVSLLMFIPKETAEHPQPFPVGFYIHGHGSNSSEPLPFIGFMVQNGIAGVMMNAYGHGIPLDVVTEAAVRSFFDAECLAPSADAFFHGRARDHDGDGLVDSGVDFWTAYVFHVRDVVRQTAIDHMRAVQILRSFDGRQARPASFEVYARRGVGVADYDADIDDDGVPDIAGDFDGNGVPDLGGPDSHYAMTGGSLGGIMTSLIAGYEPAVDASVPIVGAGGLSSVATRSENSAVISAMHLRTVGPMVLTIPDGAGCPAGETSFQWLVADLVSRGEVPFACRPSSDLGADDVMVVRNLRSQEVGCAGASGGAAGRMRVSVAADAEDAMIVELYSGALDDFDFATCAFADGIARTPDDTISTFEIEARFQTRRFELAEPLVSPAEGFGNPRQSADLRRLLLLAQAGLDPGDPINYANRVFLRPIGGVGIEPHPRSVLVANSIGDQNVTLDGGNAFARAAGVIPFLPPDGPDELAEWRAPATFASLYNHPSTGEPIPTPNDVLIAYHVLEGVEWLNRHPVPGADDFLFDVDDLSDGSMRFNPEGTHQDYGPTGLAHPRLEDRPLRWVRSSRAMSSVSDDAVFEISAGSPMSGMLNYYVIPQGTHGFDRLVYPAGEFDLAQYMINLFSHYAHSGGTDIVYATDPTGHGCLADSSCAFLPPPIAP